MNYRIFLVSALLLSGVSAFAAESKAPTVLVEFVVGADGTPTKIKVIEASNKELADSVVAAVSKWKLDKKYAGKKIRQPVEFRLGDEASKEKKG